MADTEPKKRSADDDKEGNGESAENGTKKRRTSGGDAEEAELSADAGVLLVAGGVNWDLIGRKEIPKNCKAPPAGLNVQNLWGPHAWTEKMRVKRVFSSPVACHSAIISEDGKVYTWGRNESGQLGHGDTETKHKPTLVEHLSDYTIVNVAMGRGHTLFLTDKGAVYSCGSDKLGQLGQGTEGKDKPTPSKIDYTGKPIVRMACGADFSMIVDVGGALWSFGSPEYGQLGHGTDGKLLQKANKISFVCEKSPRQITKFVEKNKQVATPITNVSISDVKCGTNHTVVLDDKSRVFTFGFAGYGRLGHAETKDEMVPRQVKQLENFRCVISKIAAGSTFCLAAATTKNLYFWGQTKSSGEATMYPKPVQDLSGWNVKNIACANKSIMVAADDTVITWGPSPTFGELCYGDGRDKSSTVPKEAKPLEGMQILDITCGFGHALLIAKDLTAEDRERIAKLPRWP